MYIYIYSIKTYTFYRCAYKVKKKKKKFFFFFIIIVLKNFRSRLCFYINLDFLQFHFLSAKIYILQIYLLNIKSFILKNKNFLYLKKSKVVFVAI